MGGYAAIIGMAMEKKKESDRMANSLVQAAYGQPPSQPQQKQDTEMASTLMKMLNKPKDKNKKKEEENLLPGQYIDPQMFEDEASQYRGL